MRFHLKTKTLLFFFCFPWEVKVVITCWFFCFYLNCLGFCQRRVSILIHFIYDMCSVLLIDHPLETLNVESDEKLERTLACKIDRVHWSVGGARALDLFHYLKTPNAGSFNSYSEFKPLQSSRQSAFFRLAGGCDGRRSTISTTGATNSCITNPEKEATDGSRQRTVIKAGLTPATCNRSCTGAGRGMPRGLKLVACEVKGQTSKEGMI